MEKGNVKLSHRSVSKYFSELKENGYLSVVGKMGNANLYSHIKDSANTKVEFKELSEQSQKIIRQEYDEKILDLILDDVSNDHLSAFEQDKSIVSPPWMVK